MKLGMSDDSPNTCRSEEIGYRLSPEVGIKLLASNSLFVVGRHATFHARLCNSSRFLLCPSTPPPTQTFLERGP